MARHQSAVRQWRRSIRRNAVNKRNKTALRTQVKDIRQKVRSGNKAEAEKLLSRVVSASDKAAKKGAIHKKKASRLKSRLSRQVRSVNPPATS